MSRPHTSVRFARRAASESNCETPMSATIVRGGQVLAVGRNQKGYRGASLHAEIDALRQLRRQKRGPEGTDIHVFRFGANGELRMSKPCRECFVALRASGISRVFYHDSEGVQQVLKVAQADPEEFYEIQRTWHSDEGEPAGTLNFK